MTHKLRVSAILIGVVALLLPRLSSMCENGVVYSPGMTPGRSRVTTELRDEASSRASATKKFWSVSAYGQRPGRRPASWTTTQLSVGVDTSFRESRQFHLLVKYVALQVDPTAFVALVVVIVFSVDAIKSWLLARFKQLDCHTLEPYGENTISEARPRVESRPLFVDHAILGAREMNVLCNSVPIRF